MITVLVADDYTVLRDRLRYLLEAQGDIQIIGMAANGQEAVEQAIQYCPDVVVMDISMPVMNGIDATRLICESCKNTKVVILSVHHTAEYMQRAMEAGAVGYLRKDSAGRELVTAIRDLKHGKSYFSQK
jgi:two-component system nitrate/nitrite response regulator NarL